ncbi:MAG: SRPBCC family protein [Pyrinomonadaceae bacterium]
MKKILLGLLVLIVLGVAVFFAPGILAGDQHNETVVQVNKSREDVWKKFADENGMKEWLMGFKKIETVSGAPMTVGSKFRITFDREGDEIHMMQTMTAIEEGKRFAFTLENEVMKSDIEVTLQDKGLVTDVRQAETYHGGNIFWHSLFYWLKSTFEANSKETLERFKKYAEGA